MPFCGLGLVAAPFVVKLQRVQRLTFVQAIVTFDWFGAVLFTGGVTVFLIGLSFGGQLFSWHAYETLLPLISGVIATVAALIYEARYAHRPVLRLSIFRNRSCACLLIAQLLQGFMVSSSLDFTPATASDRFPALPFTIHMEPLLPGCQGQILVGDRGCLAPSHADHDTLQYCRWSCHEQNRKV